jgi:hypothetical protein
MFSFLSGDLIYSCLVFYLIAFCLKSQGCSIQTPLFYIYAVSHFKGIMQMEVFESRVQRMVFGPKRDVTEGWRKLHDEKL